MTIDPRWAVALAMLIAFWNFFTSFSGLSDLGINPADLKRVIAWGDLFAGFAGIATGFLAGVPSKDNKTGFFIKGPDKPDQPK